MAISLDQLLSKIPDESRERVARTRRQMHNAIREELRRETGFLLSRSEIDERGEIRTESKNVPIELKEGLPERLMEFSFPDDLSLVLAISPFRRDLNNILQGIRGCEDGWMRFPSTPEGQDYQENWDEHIPATRTTVKALLTLLEETDPIKKILSVNEDVLGVYRYARISPFGYVDFYQNGTVELYWGVIGLVAGMMGVPIELLTGVVLTHELAHAYTHIGADIDGNRWDSEAFHNASTELVEGLAQYYTHMITYRLEQRFPHLFDIFSLLLRHQPDAYKTHDKWIREYKPEEVRYALLAIRRSGKGALSEFEKELVSAKKALRI